MVNIKTADEIKKISKASKVVAIILEELEKNTRPGCTGGLVSRL